MEALLPELADAGLVLQWAIDVEDLDQVAAAALSESDIDLDPHRSLVLLAQAGRMFWDRSVVEHLHLTNPFDDRSGALVEEWFAANRPAARWTQLYPGDVHLPLGRLAAEAGWGLPSPLGLTIHPEYGLWLAHRIVFLTDLEFDVGGNRLALSSARHPCATCVGKPCISACPASAVTASQTYDVVACAQHRVSESTSCSHQCLARNACPIGTQHRYGPDQMHHHYGAGLESIVDWLRPERR